MCILKVIFIHIIVVLAFCNNAVGQDCNSPLTVCHETELLANDSQFSSPFNSGCLNVSNSAVFEFTTNNSLANPAAFTPYEVDAQIISSSCQEAGIDLNISAAIFQPVDPLDPCGPLTEIASCVTSTDTLSLTSGILNPNTQYFLVVGYNSGGVGVMCDLSVEVSGPPLTIDACCDSEVPSGLSASLNVTGGTAVSGQETYVWQPLNTVDNFSSSNPIATPPVTTVYTVEGEVGNCITTDQVTISVGEAVTVKNTFTPNGDGINDTWTILRIENFDSALITVFDRWGQEVYKTIGYASPWDGTNDGTRLPTGTYYYVIELNSLDVEAEPIVGYVFIAH